MEQYCESNVWTYELLDWINEEKIDWCELTRNPNAIDLLEKNPEEINWDYLSLNPNAIHLLEKTLKNYIGVICHQIQPQYIYWRKIQKK